jgi:hypothetical protein
VPTTKTFPKLSNYVILGVPSQDVSSTEKAKLAASALTTCGTDNNESPADKGAINSGML